MNTLAEKRDALIDDIKSMAKGAKAAGRELSDDEMRLIEAKDAEVESLNERIKGAEMGDSLESLRYAKSGDGQGRRRHWNAKAAPAVARKMTETVQKKSFGLTEVPQSVDLFNGEPQMAESGEVGSLHQLLPIKQVESPNFEWVVENAGYQNKAAVWTPGTAKPESTTTFSRKSGKMAVVALMSSPYGQYDALDSVELVSALHTRLLDDLTVATEALIMDGHADSGFTGIRNTSGVQVQQFVTDELLTMRRGITQLERMRIVPTSFVLSHDAWERIETSRTTDGEFLFQEGPVDRVNKRIWGVPVVVTDQVGKDEAFLLSQDAVSLLYVTDQGVMVEATNTNMDHFSKNLLQTRMETRLGVAVTRPAGVVRMSLAEGSPVTV